MIMEPEEKISIVKESLINEMVRRMETRLYRPDDVVIRCLDKGDDMFLIAKGECKAIISDEFEENWESSDSEEEG